MNGKRLFVSVILTVLCGGMVSAQSEGAKRVVDLLRGTFTKNDVSVMAGRLSAGFRFNGYPQELSRMVLTGYVGKERGLEACDVLSEQTVGDTCKVEMNLTFGGPTRFVPATISMVGDSVTRMDVSMTDPMPLQKGVAAEMTAGNVYPFRLIQGMIVLDNVLIDGFRGTFVLDTGANGTVINPKTKFGYKVWKTVKERVKSVNGYTDQATDIIKVDSICMGSVKWRNMKVTTSELERMKTQLGLKELTGMLGMSLFADEELHIDYKQKKVWLAALDSDGQPCGGEKTQAKSIVPFALMSGYAPIVDVEIGGGRYKMMFDTGCAVCVFSKQYKSRWSPWLKDEKKSDLLGGNDQKVEVTKGVLQHLTLGSVVAKEVQSLFVNQTRYAGTVGILGANVLAGQHISLNYKRQELAIY